MHRRTRQPSYHTNSTALNVPAVIIQRSTLHNVHHFSYKMHRSILYPLSLKTSEIFTLPQKSYKLHRSIFYSSSHTNSSALYVKPFIIQTALLRTLPQLLENLHRSIIYHQLSYKIHRSIRYPRYLSNCISPYVTPVYIQTANLYNLPQLSYKLHRPIL
jgi:hypothetical protein